LYKKTPLEINGSFNSGRCFSWTKEAVIDSIVSAVVLIDSQLLVQPNAGETVSTK
jgi:hypothetical protein